ncbi:DUF5131 family protein [Roseinatronobacter bogoriensis]|uniref:DUF5131 family protein n=1 Tax=Roseinatronobacter bogoriensis TaxID=119542 RepID=UPI0010E205CD|nr:phage Gp37/Gp68 family protein [Rhodobaca bogoriensis]MBB4207245.1 protein gp37 [Rhodobaca bogoriensis DSM 18756]TDY65746.1 protein gp37 [Rhodobaca bogoriensis DSM 18756]
MMAENSNIEWTDHTFNPWIGCQKVSPGCDHCYAETWDARGLQQRESRWGPHATRTRTSAANWRKPLAWNRAAEKAGKRARVFCASLADVFDNHPSIQPEWRADLWQMIADTPHLDWLLLTKRPQNIERMLPDGWGEGWERVWLGTTVENQTEANRRIPQLKAVPARVRFLSCEPMHGPVDLIEATRRVIRHPNYLGIGLHWVICGGESGPSARPMHPDWARSLRDQCAAAGVAFHFKQWGEWAPRRCAQPGDLLNANRAVIVRPDGSITSGLMAYNRDAWVMDKRGKKAAGRLLDGREWNELPGAA